MPVLSRFNTDSIRALHARAQAIAARPMAVRGIDGASWLPENVEEVAAGNVSVEAFIRAFADDADHPEAGLELLAFWAAAFGEATPHVVRGDWRVLRPTLVHGDLRVEGKLNAASHLLVTGSVSAAVFDSDYDARTTVLGDVDCLAFTTDGAAYIGGELRAKSLVWTYGDGWTAAAKRCVTAMYINENDHPDEWGELVADASHEIHGPEALQALFVPELINGGRIQRWDVIDWLKEGRTVLRPS